MKKIGFLKFMVILFIKVNIGLLQKNIDEGNFIGSSA